MRVTYSSEVKAQALALALQGKTRWRIGKEMGIDSHTIGTWIANAPEIPTEQQKLIIQAAVDKTLLADELVLEAMEYIKETSREDKSILVKHMPQLCVTGGIATDKLLSFQRAPQQSINIDKAVIIIERSSPASDVPGVDPKGAAVLPSDTQEGFANASANVQKAEAETVDVQSICIDSDQP